MKFDTAGLQEILSRNPDFRENILRDSHALLKSAIECLSALSRLISIKFNAADLHLMPTISSDFRENRRREGVLCFGA
jgi:hypothetical protein